MADPFGIEKIDKVYLSDNEDVSNVLVLVREDGDVVPLPIPSLGTEDDQVKTNAQNNGTYAPLNPALQAFFDRIDNSERAVLLAFGDSTWNDGSDAFREHIDELAALMPDRSVTYRLWDDATQSYGTLSTRQVGTAGDRYWPSTGGFASAADAAAMDTTDLDVRCKVAADDWTPASTVILCGREAGDPNRQWWLSINSSARLILNWFPTGSNASAITATATAGVGGTDGQPLWLRVTLDVDNGAGGHDVKFYKSDTGGNGTWTQIGATITGGAPTVLAPVAAPPVSGSAPAATRPAPGSTAASCKPTPSPATPATASSAARKSN